MNLPGTRATVVGGGPAGLMAAEVLAAAGLHVTVVEHMPSVGRKLLLAGRSGLNLTHSEPIDVLLTRFGAARSLLAPAIMAFGPTELRAWCDGLGEQTFIGTTGRVFPKSLRATPLLRAWLRRMDALGVTIETRTHFLGIAPGGAQGGVTVRRSDGSIETLPSEVTVLALGGGSWPRVGSDGSWVATLLAAGVDVRPLRPTNCGVQRAWSPGFVAMHGGAPIKNIRATVLGSSAEPVRGDLVITDAGFEGGPIYTLSPAIRDSLDRSGSATLVLDLHPDLSVAEVAARLDRRRPKDSWSSSLKRTLGLGPATIALLREAVPSPLPRTSFELASLLKAVPVAIERLAPIDRAISSAGGISLEEVDESFMLHRLPGVFVAGEMLDWEAPTGGYLLQASFATGVAAARGALRWLTLHTPP